MSKNYIYTKPRKEKNIWRHQTVLLDLKIELSAEREDNIRDCFEDQNVDLKYPNNVEYFNYLLEIYQREKLDYNEDFLGKNMTLDSLIVMDDSVALLIDLKNSLIF